MDVRKAAQIMNGTFDLIPEGLVFTGVSTDTRDIKPGNMFIAIKGENFDGSDYIEAAFEKGASCAVTSKKSNDHRIITVVDSIKALGELAKYHRSLYKIPVIAVTGSVGKTTFKNMLISVFSQKYSVHSTEGNKNNHIGLPMTLLNITNSHDVSILEMGMSSLGEIDYLSSLAIPDYAVITNIGMAHIGILGSRENILKAKSEVMNHMKPGDIVFVNGDDELLNNIITPEFLGIIRFGKGSNNDCIVQKIDTNEKGNCTFESEETVFELPVPGDYNAINAAGVIAVARHFKIEESLIKKGLLEFSQSKMRMHRFEKDGVSYINDAYNANPQSMRAALDILKQSKGRKIAVLGDMLEMGDYSESEHIMLGEYTAETADVMIFCGSEAGNMKNGASSIKGNDNIYTFSTSDQAAKTLSEIVVSSDTVLVKGSRGMKMENVLKYTVDGGAN